MMVRSSENQWLENCKRGLLAFALYVASPLSAYAAPMLYWTDASLGTIQRANLDGTRVTTIIDGVRGISDLVLDSADQRLYWTANGVDTGIDQPPIGRGIWSAMATGAARELLFMHPTGGPTYDGLALDLSTRQIYWGSTNEDYIYRIGFNGTGNMPYQGGFVGVSRPHGFAVDEGTHSLFVTGTNEIRFFALDGTDAHWVLVDGEPRKVAIDSEAAKIYWTDSHRNMVRRANFDGTNIEDLYAGPSDPTENSRPWGIALDLQGGKIYWTEVGAINSRHSIIRCDFPPPPLVTFPPDPPRPCDLPPRIRRANLDGSLVEDVYVFPFEHGQSVGMTGFPSAIIINPIPEPGSIILMVIGFAFLLARGSTYSYTVY